MSVSFNDPKAQKKNAHLKLVVSNPTPVQKKKSLQNPVTGFITEIQEKGHPHYTLAACDLFHRLECEINLKIHSDEQGEELEDGTVVCHFPDIATDDLDELIEEDETLHGMILIQFQLKTLERILLFCGDHADALNVLVEAEDRPDGYILAAYEQLATHKDKVPTITGTKTQLLIPASQKTFDKLIDLMDDVNRDFRQTLWEDQSANPAIRNYLKSNPCLKFFG